MSEPLRKLEFLIGKWRGRSEKQFDEKGIIEGTFECAHDPGEMFISTEGESWSNGKRLNRAVTYLLWDANIKKHVRKSVYSYGWTLNEVVG